MPDFFDPPQSTPDPSNLLSVVHRDSHRRRVRRTLTAAAAAVVVLAGGGVAVSAAVAGGDSSNPSVVSETQSPTTPPRTASPTPTHTSARHHPPTRVDHQATTSPDSSTLLNRTGPKRLTSTANANAPASTATQIPSMAAIEAVVDRTVDSHDPPEQLTPRGTVEHTSDHHGGVFTAVIGQRATEYDQAHWETVFFWHDKHYVGWANNHLAFRIMAVTPISNGFRLTVVALKSQPDGFGPSHRRVNLNYVWAGNSFVSRSPAGKGVWSTEKVHRVRQV
jgi:hypothetical protein